VRWIRHYRDEEDVTSCYEIDEAGRVLRQVELRGAHQTPTVAAALAEVPDVDRDGLAAVRLYEAKYGVLAEQPIATWDADFRHVDVEGHEFEAIWERARGHLES
jgi:hypothetical protein